MFPDFKNSFPKNHFGILIYIWSWKHLFEIYFRLLRRNNKLKINNFLANIWRNNLSFNILRRKRTPIIFWWTKIWRLAMDIFEIEMMVKRGLKCFILNWVADNWLRKSRNACIRFGKMSIYMLGEKVDDKGVQCAVDDKCRKCNTPLQNF